MAKQCARQIAASGISIDDPIAVGSELWMTADLLEVLLQVSMEGHRFESVALRTRSKLAKIEVCKALGYPVPETFRKHRQQARFPGQNLDTYVQSADNLQIWNSEISPTRRYVLIRPDAHGVIQRVRVVSGADLAPLDRTGRLTKKYQARIASFAQIHLGSRKDTAKLRCTVSSAPASVVGNSPTDLPDSRTLMPIQTLFSKLSPLVGQCFENPGVLQERNRGGYIHGLATNALGYRIHSDNGRFPDIRHQLLEVKFQTSPTIDLGAVSPDCNDFLEFPVNGNVQTRHRDVRYAIFCGSISDDQITITGLVLVTGQDFYTTFERFGGLVINTKYQLRLPRDFFDINTEGIFD